MAHFRRIVILIAAVLLGTLALYPPYFGIDRASGGTLHASMGHHPIWHPPASAAVYERLTGNSSVGIPVDRLEQYQTGLNKVRLLIEAVMLVGVTGIVLLAGNLPFKGRRLQIRS